MTATTDKLEKGKRIAGTDRDQVARELTEKYTAGASIRALAVETGRSYGWVHRVLTENNVPLRGRGNTKRTKS